jgi:hypothetical protein
MAKAKATIARTQNAPSAITASPGYEDDVDPVTVSILATGAAWRARSARHNAVVGEAAYESRMSKGEVFRNEKITVLTAPLVDYAADLQLAASRMDANPSG